MTDDVDELAAETGFSGVVAIGHDVRAYGLADRNAGLPNTPDTRFGMASGSKGITALVVMSLVADGALALETTARSLLGPDLPDIDDAVTVEHLLLHRSGIGDYYDEDELADIDDPVLVVPPEQLATTESFLPLLTGHPRKFAPGTDFSYCNSGFVLLALLAERATGVGYHELARARVLQPAGMTESGFFRLDALPPRTAIGYLQDGRPNDANLPVLASGDGGMFTTADDMVAFWDAVCAGRIVAPEWVQRMLTGQPGKDGVSYGLGLKIDGPWVFVNGYDAGVAFVSRHHRETGFTWTVLGNTSEEAAPIVRHLRGVLET